MLNYSYWEKRFGANPAVLNDTLVVNSQPMAIVGVSRKGFASERQGSVPDVFMPITMRSEATADFTSFSNRLDHWVAMFARLKPGVSTEQATAVINAPYKAQLEEDVALLRTPGDVFLQQFRAKTIVLRPASTDGAICATRAARPCC